MQYAGLPHGGADCCADRFADECSHKHPDVCATGHTDRSANGSAHRCTYGIANDGAERRADCGPYNCSHGSTCGLRFHVQRLVGLQ
jgi:hypothetical protein